MKRLFALLIALTMLLAMTACGDKNNGKPSNGSDTPSAGNAATPSDNGSTSSGKREQITFWFWGAATDYQVAMKDILAGWYNSSQDKYELNIEFRNTVDVDIPRALAAGNAPDIIYASGPSYTSTYVAENLVLNLDSYAEQYGWKDRILGGIYDSLTVNGSLYSIPGGMNVGGIFYNKDLFAEKGWSVPETWDEMTALFQAAQAEGVYPTGAGNKGWKPCNDHFSSQIINHYGGSDLFYKVLTGEIRFDDPAMVDAVQLTADWYQAGYMAGEDYVNLDSVEVMQVLADGRCALVTAPTLYIQFIGQLDEAAQERIGFAPMPSAWTDEDVYDMAINCNFSINASTPYADECAKILDYMLTGEFSGKLTEAWPGYWAVPVKDVVNYDASGMTGMSKLTMDAVQTGIGQIDKGYFAFHPSTFFPAATVTAFEDIDTVWQGVVSAQDFCSTVAAELDADIAAGAVVPLAKPVR